MKGQQQTLGRTEIVMPFNARIGLVQVEEGEFVTVGMPLFEALDIKGVEIEAEISSFDTFALVSHLSDRELSVGDVMDNQLVTQLLNLEASVRLVGGRKEAQWPARVLRFADSVNVTRRMIGVVVGIDNPYDKVIPGERPPLVKGMYTAVDFLTPEWDAIVVPRSALHEGRVYTIDQENWLRIVPVHIGLMQNEQVVIQSGLQPGDHVILSDIAPVVEGMRVQPIFSQDQGMPQNDRNRVEQEERVE